MPNHARLNREPYKAHGKPVSAAVFTPRSRDRQRAQALRSLTEGTLVVYACRAKDGTIKIGCTAHLARRRVEIGGGELLGFTLGDFADEAAIHEALKPHRAHGREWYHPTAQVLAVVNEMRDAFGLPHLVA